MKPKTPQSRYLLLDIETAPNVGYTWGKWEQNVIEFVDQWYILSFAYKWLGGRTKVVALPDYRGYHAGQKDQNLCKTLWRILDRAEVVIAQNGDKFDIRKINTRFLQHKMKPPSPYKTIDTLKVARKFAFNSNSLNELGRDLGEGEKVKHEGFALWKGCMAGKRASWEIMKKYNKRDVDLLERIYLRLRPWTTNHPNRGHLANCPKCGSDRTNSRGEARSKTMVYKKYQCQNCGGWFRGARGERYSLVTNA